MHITEIIIRLPAKLLNLINDAGAENRITTFPNLIYKGTGYIMARERLVHDTPASSKPKFKDQKA